MSTETPTETLTDDMIRALRDGAANHGDRPMVRLCDFVLHGTEIDDSPMTSEDEARQLIADAITDARAAAVVHGQPWTRVVP